MFELEKTDEVRKLIAITKSDSGISGPSLADAHFRLGELLAESMPFDPQETTVMAILRGGIFLRRAFTTGLDAGLIFTIPSMPRLSGRVRGL